MTLVSCTSMGADCFLESHMVIQLFSRELVFKISNFIICADSLDLYFGGDVAYVSSSIVQKHICMMSMCSC